MITTWILVCTLAAMDVPLKTTFTSEEWTQQVDANTYMFTHKTEKKFYVYPRTQCALLVKEEPK